MDTLNNDISTNVAISPELIRDIGDNEIVNEIDCKKCEGKEKVSAWVYRAIIKRKNQEIKPKIENIAKCGKLSTVPDTKEKWKLEKERVVEQYAVLRHQYEISDNEAEKVGLKRKIHSFAESQHSALKGVKKLLEKQNDPILINHCSTCRKLNREEKRMRKETVDMTEEEATQYRKEHEEKGYINSLKKLKALDIQ